jgi:hypothetical protein
MTDNNPEAEAVQDAFDTMVAQGILEWTGRTRNGRPTYRLKLKANSTADGFEFAPPWPADDDDRAFRRGREDKEHRR